MTVVWNPGDCGPEDDRECAEGCASWEGDECDCRSDKHDFVPDLDDSHW
jgi:hypothetical protein